MTPIPPLLDVVGIDIGSVALSLVLTDTKGSVLHSSYQFHKGKIRETLRAMLSHVDCRRVGAVAMTLSGPDILRRTSRYDSQISMIAAVRHFHRKVGSILFVGGEKFGLVTFNEEGDYERYRSNTSCAAGTGSFLDQQAIRLNLKSIDLLSEVAFCNQGSAPKIATRCAVFAKTDPSMPSRRVFIARSARPLRGLAYASTPDAGPGVRTPWSCRRRIHDPRRW